MAWPKVCKDIIGGICVGGLQGLFGISLFTPEEAVEVANLQKLALSMIEKAPKIAKEATQPAVCEAIREGQKSALNSVLAKAPADAAAVGAVAAAELVCNKAFSARFADVLMGACLNLVGC
jgi:hypothetical protein